MRPGPTDGDEERQEQRCQDEERLEVATHEGLFAGCMLEEVHCGGSPIKHYTQ